MNILWCSNYTVPSGYGLQSRLFIPRLQRLGYKITVMDIRQGGGSTAQIGDVTVLPTALDPLGNDIIPLHAQRSKSDVVITLCDAWGFAPDTMKIVNWYPIVPVDHTPVPPAAVNSLQAARGAIALSRFGQSELSKVGIEASYWPHAYDASIWFPALTPNDMNAARRRLHLSDDAFVVSFVGVNDSNPSRKGIPELLAAWSMFEREHRGSILYLHTTPQGNIPIAGAKNGVDIDAIVKTYGINPGSIMMPDQYRLRTGIAAPELADMMRASDAFILPSRGEGFGIPLIEAQACGTPVITTDFASGGELCASGWKIDYELNWSWQNSTYASPGIASIADRLVEAYAARGNMRERVEAATFAREFEVEYVTTKYAAPVLRQIAEHRLVTQG